MSMGRILMVGKMVTSVERLWTVGRRGCQSRMTEKVVEISFCRYPYLSQYRFILVISEQGASLYTVVETHGLFHPSVDRFLAEKRSVARYNQTL